MVHSGCFHSDKPARLRRILFACVLNWRDAVPTAMLFARPAMRALLVALLYFGSFLAIGLIAKLAVGRLTRDTGSLSDIQSQAGTNRRKLKAFLLGAWRNED
jgi:hypothetical protein